MCIYLKTSISSISASLKTYIFSVYMIHEMRISSIDAPSIDVGIREEICLNDANIGLKFTSHQLKKDGKRYSRQGLFPDMERVSGMRRFSDTEIEALRVIECLKKTGMEIRDIRQFMNWCVEWPSTYPQRRAMFEAQRAHMEAQLAEMNRTLDMIRFKCWYYEQAMKDGNEDRLKALIPDQLPDEIREAYENAHKK